MCTCFCSDAHLLFYFVIFMVFTYPVEVLNSFLYAVSFDAGTRITVFLLIPVIALLSTAFKLLLLMVIRLILLQFWKAPL